MALLDNLISYWKLDESSGNALDAHGGNELTDNNTVGSATGMIGNARDFEAGSTEYFSHADNADLSAGDVDFTFCAWVQLESLAITMTIASKHNGVSEAGSEWFLRWNASTGLFELNVYSGGSTTNVAANNFGVASTATWYHVVIWHDATNNLIGISINDGTPDTASHSIGVNDIGEDFRIGAINPVVGWYWDGLIDEAGFWKRMLTSEERTELYAGGSGLSYENFDLSSSDGTLGCPHQMEKTYRPAPFAPGVAR